MSAVVMGRTVLSYVSYLNDRNTHLTGVLDGQKKVHVDSKRFKSNILETEKTGLLTG